MAKDNTTKLRESKRRFRANPYGHVYDRARSETLTELSRRYPDEYAELMEKFKGKHRRLVKQRLKASA